MKTQDIIETLGMRDWGLEHNILGYLAAAISVEVYASFKRDQGTPYIEHPVQVAVILKDELHTNRPELLIIALLHDALEVNELLAAEKIGEHLGEGYLDKILAMSKDHKLFQYQRGTLPGNQKYHEKIKQLPDELLIVKLADRIHNLRELHLTTDQRRQDQYLSALDAFYIPLAKERSECSLEIQKAYDILVKTRKGVR